MFKKLGIVLGALVLVHPALGHADSTIKTPGDHPHYRVEIEPHGVIGWDFYGLGFGVGAGVRASIPIMENGFVRTINDVPAITFGVDWMHYDSGCFYVDRGACAGLVSNTFYFPVGLQWNFFVARQWSVFGEIGVAPYFRSYGDYCSVQFPSSTPEYDRCRDANPVRFSATPWGSIGGRFHFNEHVALTMRIGIPGFTLGVSFM
jgi:hypothetical protein